MKKIYKIARMELQTLFYSPIAWLILVVFTVQTAVTFFGTFGTLFKMQTLGNEWSDITKMLFYGSGTGLFFRVQNYLYLYMPLLTMGVISREFSSGSIKLLYSSPITNRQIVFGKFLSMMLYGLVLMVILLLFVICAVVAVENLDVSAVFAGLLGLYLLLCTYAAVGLFMSCLTSYQIVAAILTLTTLGLLNYIKYWWQDVEFVREITYWLSISGRASEFIKGLICSEDFLYFVIVSALFLGLTIIRLQANRQKSFWGVTLGKYVGVLVCACCLGYLSSQPKLMTYYDATETKKNTLTANSQKIIDELKGDLTITTYVNVLDLRDLWSGLPEGRMIDRERFRHYLRFKPEIRMNYVYYYDTINDSSLDSRYPHLNTKQRAQRIMELHDLDSTLVLSQEEIRSQIDLSQEGNKFVRLLESENGRSTFLRTYSDVMHFPFESEISAAFKRLVMDVPKIGFLVGHGERDIKSVGDRGYSLFAGDKSFRYALLNQGFDVEEVNLDKEITADIKILVIAEIRKEINEIQYANLKRYIAGGGNILILNEPKYSKCMANLLSEFGVEIVPGVLVRNSKDNSPDLITATPTKEAGKMIYQFEGMLRDEQMVSMPSASGLTYRATGAGYEVTPLFVTDSLVWNELESNDLLDDTVRVNVHGGEVQQRYVTGVALKRVLGGKEQRILILGDADCISNGELNKKYKGVKKGNFNVIMGSFFWLSNDEVPIDVRRAAPIDNNLNLEREDVSVWRFIMLWIIPSLLVVFSIVIWLRRRGR